MQVNYMVNKQLPVATKRAMRAMLNPAADLCASQPERAARRLVDRGFAPRYDDALQTLSDVPYDRWREYHPEDTAALLRALPP
jgi:NitT/TauT family transport system substrate-binding protein